MGAELFHTGGRTDRHRQEDMTKLTVAFHNFANASIKRVLPQSATDHHLCILPSSSGLVILFKFMYAFVQVCNICVVTIRFWLTD